MIKYIPIWDIFIIPLWYNIVKGDFMILTRIKELRVARGISQMKMAIDLGMNQNSISRYENGTRQADYETIIAIADYFDVSIDYLLLRTNNPNINK